MSPEEFQRIGIRMYGRKHWRREYSIHLGLDASTIWRISTREKPIPAVVEVAVRGLLEKHKVLTKLAGDLREKKARERHRYKGRASRRKPLRPEKRPRTVIHYNPPAQEISDESLETPATNSASQDAAE